MSKLYAYLASVFGGFTTILTAWLGKKAAMSVALISAYVAAIGTLWSAIKLLVGSIVYLLPQGDLATWIYIGLNFALPANWDICLAAMLSADVAVFLYRFNQNRIVGVAAQG
jgi:hypothetical protein